MVCDLNILASLCCGITHTKAAKGSGKDSILQLLLHHNNIAKDEECVSVCVHITSPLTASCGNYNGAATVVVVIIIGGVLVGDLLCALVLVVLVCKDMLLLLFV